MMWPNCACKSGAPSLLGRLGGPTLGAGLVTDRTGFAGDDSDGDIITGFAGAEDDFEGDSSISSDFAFLNF